MSSDSIRKISAYERLTRHVNRRLISGLLLLLPLGITLFVMKYFFTFTASLLLPIMKKLFGDLPEIWQRAASIAAFIVLIYLAGSIAALVIGRKLVALGEAVILRLPILKTIYLSSKKVVETFSVSNRQAFKSVVFLEFPRVGLRSVGFITGSSQDEHGRDTYRVFVPTTPNPTSGFLLIVPEAGIIRTDMSVEEGIRMIMSGGILGPEKGGGIPGLTQSATPSLSLTEAPVPKSEEQVATILKSLDS